MDFSLMNLLQREQRMLNVSCLIGIMCMRESSDFFKDTSRAHRLNSIEDQVTSITAEIYWQQQNKETITRQLN